MKVCPYCFEEAGAMGAGDEVVDFCHECFLVIEGNTLESPGAPFEQAEYEAKKFNRLLLDTQKIKEENKDLRQLVEDHKAASVKLAEQLIYERDNWDYAREVILAVGDYIHLKEATGVPIRMGDQKKGWASVVMAYQQYEEWEHNL